jgi:hypothetical protein
MKTKTVPARWGEVREEVWGQVVQTRAVSRWRAKRTLTPSKRLREAGAGPFLAAGGGEASVFREAK